MFIVDKTYVYVRESLSPVFQEVIVLGPKSPNSPLDLRKHWLHDIQQNPQEPRRINPVFGGPWMVWILSQKNMKPTSTKDNLFVVFNTLRTTILERMTADKRIQSPKVHRTLTVIEKYPGTTGSFFDPLSARRRNPRKKPDLLFFITDKARANGRAKKPVRMGTVRLCPFSLNPMQCNSFLCPSWLSDCHRGFLYVLCTIATRWSLD